MKKKLVYILPEYSSQSSSHYGHIYDLLINISENIDVFVIVEKYKDRWEEKKLAGIYHQKIQKAPFSLFERLVIIIALRLKGYTNYYIHYSIFSSIIASLIIKISGGFTAFWYCQMRSLYKHPRWEDWAFSLNLKLVSAFVTCNVKMKNYFHNTFRIPVKKISVLPLWINPLRFNKDKHKINFLKQKYRLEKKKTVLFVHWLSERKGAHNLVTIYESLEKKIRGMKMLIVGNGPLYESIKNEIRQRELGGKIFLIGAVSNDEIKDYFYVSDVFLMPSKEEEFGRVMLEAMYCKVPIIASDTFGPQTVMSNFQKKFLCPTNKIEEFSDKIAEILKNNKLSMQLVNEGIYVVKKYDISKVSKTFISLATR